MIKKYYKLIIFLLVVFIIFLIYKDNHNHYFNYTSLGDGFALGINSYGEIDYSYSDFIKDEFLTDKRLKLYTKDFSKKDQSIEHLYESITTNEKITIETQANETYNEVKWQNGEFLVKLPKEIIALQINNVTINNSSVRIENYELIENEEGLFIKIVTKNDTPQTYTITLDVDLSPDPRIPTTTKQIEL